jgi:hypothetical protein
MKQGLSVVGMEKSSSTEDNSNSAGDRRIGLLSAVQTLVRVAEVRAALIVVELQLAVVGERDVEVKGPVPGHSLAEAEVRLPSVQVSRQANRVVPEAAFLDVVRSPPHEAPFLRRIETDPHLKQLASRQT